MNLQLQLTTFRLHIHLPLSKVFFNHACLNFKRCQAPCPCDVIDRHACVFVLLLQLLKIILQNKYVFHPLILPFSYLRNQINININLFVLTF
jgi:hypothetical protein